MKIASAHGCAPSIMPTEHLNDNARLTIAREDHGNGRGQFVMSRDGIRLGTLDYHGDDSGPIYVDFVEVSPAIQGTGRGRQLVEAAVGWARESQRAIVPICSYSRSVIERDASLQDVLKR